jgi:hypothetical protein
MIPPSAPITAPMTANAVMRAARRNGSVRGGGAVGRLPVQIRHGWVPGAGIHGRHGWCGRLRRARGAIAAARGADAPEGSVDVGHELFVGEFGADEGMGAEADQVFDFGEVEGGLHQERKATSQAQPGQEADEAVAGHVKDVTALAAVDGVEVHEYGVHGPVFDVVEELVPGRSDTNEVMRDAQRFDKGGTSGDQSTGGQYDRLRLRLRIVADLECARDGCVGARRGCGRGRRDWPVEQRWAGIRMQYGHESVLLG